LKSTVTESRKSCIKPSVPGVPCPFEAKVGHAKVVGPKKSFLGRLLRHYIPDLDTWRDRAKLNSDDVTDSRAAKRMLGDLCAKDKKATQHP